jgi:hypothetical protein
VATRLCTSLWILIDCRDHQTKLEFFGEIEHKPRPLSAPSNGSMARAHRLDRSDLFFSEGHLLCAMIDGSIRWMATILFDEPGDGWATIHLSDGHNVKVPANGARSKAQLLAMEMLEAEGTPVKLRKAEALKLLKAKRASEAAQ